MSTSLSPAIAKLFLPDVNALPIILPETKSLGRIWIPFQYIVRTSGIDRYLNNHPHAPSLCMLFQNGRCNSGAKCNQIHVDKSYTAAVTAALTFTATSNCCLAHGDMASTSNNLFENSQPETIELRRENLPVILVSPSQIAVTLFWYRFLKQKRRVLFFTPDRICNLHQQNECKYGVECKNVHLCREFWSQIMSVPSAPMYPTPNFSGTDDFYAGNQYHNEGYISTGYGIPMETYMDLDEAELHTNLLNPPSPPLRYSKALEIVHPSSGVVIPSRLVQNKRPTAALPIVDPLSGHSVVPPATESRRDSAVDDLTMQIIVSCQLTEPAWQKAMTKLNLCHSVESTLTISAPAQLIKNVSSDSVDTDISLTPSSELHPQHFASPNPNKTSPTLLAGTFQRPTPPASMRKVSNQSTPRENWGSGLRTSPTQEAGSGWRSPRELQKTTEEWVEHAEASRGRFKNVFAGLIGITSTIGPSTGKGFGMGRGTPLSQSRVEAQLW